MLKVFIDNKEIKDAYKVEIIINDKDHNDHFTVYGHVENIKEFQVKYPHMKYIKGVYYGHLDKLIDGNIYLKSFSGTYE